MRKNISIALNVLCLLLILDAANFFNNLLLFVIAGVIPGTNVSVSPLVMMFVILTLGLLLALKIFRNLEIKEDITARAMPRKRYARP